MPNARHYAVRVTSPEAPARKPLLLVALALAIIQVRAEFHGFDALPDPIGWLVIAGACRVLPPEVPRRSAVVGSAVIAAVTAVSMWPSAWNDRVRALTESLLWAIALPGLAWSVLFCLAMTALAQGEMVSSLLWKSLAGAFLASAILPVVVFGGDADWLEGTYAAISTAAQVALFVLAIAHAWKPWATFAPEPG